MLKNTNHPYKGFEQGPIRPPSEAGSLLIRVSRNCPWNHCTFCPVYKKQKFSLRPLEDVIKDIDTVHHYISKRHTKDRSHQIKDPTALEAVHHWNHNSMTSIFLQDANSMIIKPHDLITILTHLRHRFPWVKRITTYGRSHTIARISDHDLSAIHQAGLTRIHIGMESGCDEVLKMVKKGSTKAMHIKAGQKVKQAGMELSEYIMPGLGGQKFSQKHALESADALNQIDPDFIRLRTLALPNGLPIFQQWQSGDFQKCTDLMTVKEILVFLENLNGITSIIKSDHILNLFEEIQGRLPEDRQQMLNVLHTFLEMPPARQCLFQVGRRIGIFNKLVDLDNPSLCKQAKQTCQQFGINPDNVDQMIMEMMKRFV